MVIIVIIAIMTAVNEWVNEQDKRISPLPPASSYRFVFMALMEYCLVNIILGDSDAPKLVNDPPKLEKVFDLAAKVPPTPILLPFLITNH